MNNASLWSVLAQIARTGLPLLSIVGMILVVLELLGDADPRLESPPPALPRPGIAVNISPSVVRAGEEVKVEATILDFGFNWNLIEVAWQAESGFISTKEVRNDRATATYGAPNGATVDVIDLVVTFESKDGSERSAVRTSVSFAIQDIGNAEVYEVRTGDTVISISQGLLPPGVDLSMFITEIQRVNGIAVDDELIPGQVLVIPASGR